MKTDSIIFDLDGTLWDAADTVAKAWQAAKKQVDFEIQDITPEAIRNVAGMQHDLIFKKLFPDLSEAQQQELMEISGKEEMAHIRKYGGELYPNLTETLQYLQPTYKLFIVSNCQDGYIEAFLEFNELHTFFPDFECSGRTGNPKNENIRAIIQRNNLQNPVYIGDTSGDQQAAEKAGVPFIYARYGFGQLPKYEQHLDQFTDLKKLF